MTRARLAHGNRRSRRHAVALTATIRVRDARHGAQICRLRNMSLGGAFIEVGRLPMGTAVHLTFALPIMKQRLSIDAIVQWCTNEGIGVQFGALRAWEMLVLWDYLASLARRESALDRPAPEDPAETSRRPIAMLQPSPVVSAHQDDAQVDPVRGSSRPVPAARGQVHASAATPVWD